MGGSASCLSNSSLSPLCKKKTKTRVIKVKALKNPPDEKRCKYCNCKNEECRIRNNGEALQAAENFRHVRCGTGNESIFVENAQFPYHRPKTLPVKPYIIKNDKPATRKDVLFTDSHDHYVAPKPIYGFYPYKNLQRLTISEPTTYLHRQTQQPKSYEQLQRSASYNPGTTHPNGHFLPNRTVERLKNTESYQYFRHERYPPDLFTNHFADSRHSSRPPTPPPWLLPKRTNDYLVASSLLAAEQERDRHLSRHQ